MSVNIVYTNVVVRQSLVGTGAVDPRPGHDWRRSDMSMPDPGSSHVRAVQRTWLSWGWNQSHPLPHTGCQPSWWACEPLETGETVVGSAPFPFSILSVQIQIQIQMIIVMEICKAPTAYSGSKRWTSIVYNTHNVHRDGKCWQQFNPKLTHNADINKGIICLFVDSR